MVDGQLIGQFLNVFSFVGTIVFAISGALIAAEKKMDILGFILIGTVTAIGGGTLRDLLLGISPVSWVLNPFNIYLCIAVSSVTYFTVNLFRKRDDWILWMDAIGLAAFTVMGTEAALHHQAPAIVAIVMGVMTATFGGIMRDVLCAEILTLMRPEIYITCALLGAVVYVLLSYFAVPSAIVASCAFSAAFGLRAAAMVWRLTLPRWGKIEG
ncbi:MAG: trimeric intracellular cation channel family protein [Pseudomonadales bacterium]